MVCLLEVGSHVHFEAAVQASKRVVECFWVAGWNVGLRHQFFGQIAQESIVRLRPHLDSRSARVGLAAELSLLRDTLAATATIPLYR